MMELTALERAVLVKLLDGDHPVLEQLRGQLPSCRVSHREKTGAGFYACLDVGGTCGALDVKARLGDVLAEIEGMTHGAGFVLFVEGGRLKMLEGYGFDEQWPTSITSFTLKYCAGEKRDLKAIGRVLG